VFSEFSCELKQTSRRGGTDFLVLLLMLSPISRIFSDLPLESRGSVSEFTALADAFLQNCSPWSFRLA